MTQKKILVVDDEAPMRKLLGSNLQANGYAVRTASDGAEALRMIDEHPVDLGLLDLNMPGPNGLLVLEAVRRYAEMPILIVSGRVSVTKSMRSIWVLTITWSSRSASRSSWHASRHCCDA